MELLGQARGTGDEAAVMQAMAEMRQRRDDELRSNENERYCASSDDEVVVVSALQLQLQQVAEQPQRDREPPKREKAPTRSTTPPDGATRKPPCVSGGRFGRQKRMLERDDNSSACEQGAKYGGLTSPTDARIHMR